MLFPLSFYLVINMIMSLHIISLTFSVFLPLNIIIKSPFWFSQDLTLGESNAISICHYDILMNL